MSRKYPPSKGGMQTAAYELYTTLVANKHNEVMLVKSGAGNKLLPVVYPWLFVRALVAGLQHRPDVIYLQDGIMAPLGWMLKLLLRRPTLITIHGLEATYGNPIYKILVPPFVKLQTRLVTVSNDTKRVVEQVFPTTKPLLIFNGVSDSFYAPGKRDEQLTTVAAAAGMSAAELSGRQLLLTNGRLVRRKGVLWFIDNVLPKLVADNPRVLYLVSGGGKDREVIQAAISDKAMGDYVRLLGRVPDDVRDALYNLAEIFVMPNIPVSGDMEGMGLVALEAATCGAMVVASDLEGIPDAIQNGKNGVLVKPGDAAGYVATLTRELKHRSIAAGAVRTYTLANYAWTKRAHDYEAIMQQLVTGK
ncbi:MAG TPA: glycosyltransferase family 4 protein [Candidatus Saccharimonadales bacterium]|nr:glycosyltransferase family 4 protein [Candidatus Saccharimonadales bacterium]